jgi:four helix bundle protein
MPVEKLRVYVRARELASTVLNEVGPLIRQYKLRVLDQLTASCTSVTHCIAEGYGRSTTGEFLQMLSHANGSIQETIDALEDMAAMSLISDAQTKRLQSEYRKLSVQLLLLAAASSDRDPTYRGKYLALANRGRSLRRHIASRKRS